MSNVFLRHNSEYILEIVFSKLSISRDLKMRNEVPLELGIPVDCSCNKLSLFLKVGHECRHVMHIYEASGFWIVALPDFFEVENVIFEDFEALFFVRVGESV